MVDGLEERQSGGAQRLSTYTVTQVVSWRTGFMGTGFMGSTGFMWSRTQVVSEADMMVSWSSPVWSDRKASAPLDWAVPSTDPMIAGSV